MSQKKRHVQLLTDHTHRTQSPVLKRWKDLSPEDRHREIVRAASRHGGQAVTLNMAPQFADCLATTANPMRRIGKRMNAQLQISDLATLPIMLVLEATRDDGRPHLHGVFVANGVPKLRIQSVMRRAVGVITGRSGSRQFKAKNLYAADGWTRYIHKDGRATRRLLDLAGDARLTWISQSMTQFAQNHYEAVRLGQVVTGNSNIGPRSNAS